MGNNTQFAKKLLQKPRVLVDATLTIPIPSSSIRKGIVKNMKRINRVGFEKGAIFGGGTLIKVTILFAIGASGLKKLKYFKDKEEAFK